MKKRKAQTEQEISDEVAAQALFSGSKSQPVDTHPSMQPDPTVDAEDEADAQDDDFYDDDKGY
jgi:Tfp pilus assembly protein FimV